MPLNNIILSDAQVMRLALKMLEMNVVDISQQIGGSGEESVFFDKIDEHFHARFDVPLYRFADIMQKALPYLLQPMVESIGNLMNEIENLDFTIDIRQAKGGARLIFTKKVSESETSVGII